MARRKSSKDTLSALTRIVYFVIGLGMASALLVYSIQWDALPFRVYNLGLDITPYALASGLVLVSIFAGTLIKSALYGRIELD